MKRAKKRDGVKKAEKKIPIFFVCKERIREELNSNGQTHLYSLHYPQIYDNFLQSLIPIFFSFFLVFREKIFLFETRKIYIGVVNRIQWMVFFDRVVGVVSILQLWKVVILHRWYEPPSLLYLSLLWLFSQVPANRSKQENFSDLTLPFQIIWCSQATLIIWPSLFKSFDSAKQLWSPDGNQLFFSFIFFCERKRKRDVFWYDIYINIYL